MPQPTRSQGHVDKPLTNISIAYEQSAVNFVAARAFPLVRVQKDSDKYFIYDKDYWFLNQAKVRGPGAESAGGGFSISNDTYNCITYAYHQDVADQIARNVDQPISLERDAARYVAQKMMISRERKFASVVFGASAWGTTVTGGSTITQWDNVNSTPIEDVAKYQNTILEQNGVMANTLIVGAGVHRHLRNHPDILDRIKYTQRGIVTDDLLAALFEVDRYLVMRATYNTAAENATESDDFAVASGTSALLCYTAPAPSLLTPSAGYMFQSEPLVTKRFYMDENSAWRIEAEEAFDFKVVASTCGVEFVTAVSAS